MNYTQQDVNDLAYCSWMEARGDGDDAMRAVQHVIVNRIPAPGFPKNVHAVVYEKNQFSWTIPGNPEYGKQPVAGDAQYAYALSIAPAVLSASDTDNTFGALYYANESQITSGWYERVIIQSGKFPVTAVIGSQTFRS